mgnify:CR=1 FL=1
MEEGIREHGMDIMKPDTRFTILTTILFASFLLLVAAAGCGGEAPEPVSGEQPLAEEALKAAFNGDNQAFLSLVAPSFLEEVGQEMPDVEDEVLGGILVAGFMEDVPYTGMKEVRSQVDTSGDNAVVHVWGVFLDENGEEVTVREADALRITLVKENGKWYLDLLDL